MIKECFVKLNNELVTVVTFNGVDIQFPAIHKKVKSIFVEKYGNQYRIVDKPVDDNKKHVIDHKDANVKHSYTRKQQKPKHVEQQESIAVDNIESETVV